MTNEAVIILITFIRGPSFTFIEHTQSASSFSIIGTILLIFFLSFYFIFVCRCLDWTSALRRKWSLDASVAAFFSQSTTLLLMWLRYAGCEWRFSVERIWKMAIEYRIAGTHTFLFSIIWYYSEQSTGLVAIYMNSLASIGKGTSGSIVAGIAPACDGNKKEMMLEKRKRINIPHEIYQYSI